MQQEYEVIISNQAEIELNRILDYIEYELLEPSIAKNLFLAIKETMIKLENFPERNPILKGRYILGENIRKCSVNNYIIIYKVVKELKRVEISHIFYDRKDWLKTI